MSDRDECGGCVYWDGDDGRCRNEGSQYFMDETDEGCEKRGDEMDRETVITHLQIIHTWAEFARERDLQFFAPKHLEDIAEWSADAIAMLKEQEAVKPVLDEQTGRIWLCGKCGSYVGYEVNDPDDLNEFDKHCRNCGTPVLWEGR